MLNKLIFVWIGDNLPEWAIISLQIAVKNSGCNVLLLTSKIDNRVDHNCQQYEISTFYTNTFKNFTLNNNENFRDGFWIKTTERFFVINQFVKKYGIKSFFHAELDNLIFNLSDLNFKLDKIGNGLFVPKDTIERCIASLIYINETSEFDNFCNFINVNPLNLSNDMLLLGEFSKNNDKFFNLPNESIFNKATDIKYIDYKEIDGTFDAASIGQFLFGIDPRNTIFLVFNKFINENCKYNLNNCYFEISIEKNFAFINKIRLYNIHIHSKIFKKIVNEIWLKRTVSRLNNNKKTFISFKYL